MHNLRRFEQNDADGVKNLILTILSKEYPFDKAAYSDSDLNKISEVYGGGRDSFFVIQSGNEIAGTVGVKEETKEDALLRRLFVDVKHRKHGYGTELLKAAIGFCKDNGYKHIIFRCTDRMGDAMRLCEKNGFRESEKLEIGGFHIHKLQLDL